MYNVYMDEEGTKKERWTREQVVKEITWRVPEILGDQTDDNGEPRFDDSEEIRLIENASIAELMNEWRYYVGTAIEVVE